MNFPEKPRRSLFSRRFNEFLRAGGAIGYPEADLQQVLSGRSGGASNSLKVMGNL
jgi:hypothetical protein